MTLVVLLAPAVCGGELTNVAASVTFHPTGCALSVALQWPLASATASAACVLPKLSATALPGAAPAPQTSTGAPCCSTAPPVKMVLNAKPPAGEGGVGAGGGVGPE